MLPTFNELFGAKYWLAITVAATRSAQFGTGILWLLRMYVRIRNFPNPQSSVSGSCCYSQPINLIPRYGKVPAVQRGENYPLPFRCFRVLKVAHKFDKALSRSKLCRVFNGAMVTIVF